MVARDLLGKLLIRRDRRLLLAGRIVEAEAYLGAIDPGAHAYRGQTPRNAVLFGPPGHAYVYFIYGMYQCLNVVCEPDGTAGGVLIRALEPLAGIEIMRSRRPSARKVEQLASGPGKLTLAMAVTLQHNGVDVTRGSLTVREPIEKRRFEIQTTPRIGISQCVEAPLRFLIAGNRSTSKSPRLTEI